MQLTRDGDAVAGVVHNIGSKPADVVIALLDDTGKPVSSSSLGSLAAPLDLHPKTISFRFDAVPPGARGWTVVADPENSVSEIYEGNNRIEIPLPTGR
jgi:hypothetical protein